MPARKDFDWKNIGLGVAAGAVVAAACGVAGLVAKDWEGCNSVNHQRHPDVDAAEEPLDTRKDVFTLRSRGRGNIAFELFNKQGTKVGDSNPLGVAKVRASAIPVLGYWHSPNANVSLFVQTPSGSWELLGQAQPGARTPLKLPIICVGGNVVHVYKFPPSRYSPTESNSDPNTCAVCLNYVADTTVLPCAHLSLCWTCMTGLRNTECPTCRKEVSCVSYNYKT